MAEDMRPNGTAAAPVSEDHGARARALSGKALEMLSSGLIVTLPEPAQRSRSYRELILQEMNWMASDFYHERRWKVHTGRQLCIGIKESILDRKKLNKHWSASECSVYIKRFWANIVSNAADSAGTPGDLAEYCARFGRRYRKYVQTDAGCSSSDYDIGERDMIAVTVPMAPPAAPAAAAPGTGVVPAPLSAAKLRNHKTEVLEATILNMLSMGADLYSPVFRPPDDELDMFTMPLMDPVCDNDFNALLVQNFCLKHCETPMCLPRGKQVTLPDVVPPITRRFNRQTNEPSCLAISMRDFDLQVKPKPPFQGIMVQTKLTSIDFELLDAWMFKDSPSWPMLAVCLSYRSSASGLHRCEFSSEYCREVFTGLNRQPRGLVNSSRRLLGPRQRNAITTFLDSPPTRPKFRGVVDCAADHVAGAAYVMPRVARRITRRRAVPAAVTCGHSLRNTRPAKRSRSGFRDGFLSLSVTPRASASSASNRHVAGGLNRARGHREGTAAAAGAPPSKRAVHSASSRSGPVQRSGSSRSTGVSRSSSRDTAVQLPFSDTVYSDVGALPVSLLQRKDKGNFIGLIKQTLSRQRSHFLEEVSASEAKGDVIALPRDAMVEAAMASGKGAIPRCFRSDRTIGPVLHMPNVPYGEYSNRMSKQLRVGFLGIPAKMFAHSLFYSGRFCKNNRVRRVAVTISNATKVMMPQPNLLYARLFENDAVQIFGRFRHVNWQKALEHSPDPHGELLLKKYTTEVMMSSSSKKTKSPASPELQVMNVLAGYVSIRLSRGGFAPQGSLRPDKTLLKDVEQVVPNSQPLPMPQPQVVTAQMQHMAPMQHMCMPGPTMSPHALAHPAMAPPAMQPPQGPMGHPSMPSSPMQPPPMAVAGMQPGPMAHGPMPPGPMPPGVRTPGSMTPGSMTPGPAPPGHMPPHAQLPPGGLAPGQMTPGSMTPGHMPPVKLGGLQPGQLTPGKMATGPIPGMPPPSLQQQAMAGKASMQLQLDAMKRRPPMDMAGKRRPMMPYDQMYPPQVAMPPYRYRPMPDMNMMRMPMYPMAMYGKQVPYPKAHEDQFRSPHVQR